MPYPTTLFHHLNRFDTDERRKPESIRAPTTATSAAPSRSAITSNTALVMQSLPANGARGAGDFYATYQHNAGQPINKALNRMNITLRPEDDDDDYYMSDDQPDSYMLEDKKGAGNNGAFTHGIAVVFDGNGGGFVQSVPVPKSAVSAWVKSKFTGSAPTKPAQPPADPLNRATFKFSCPSESTNLSAFREALEAQPTPQASTLRTTIRGKLLGNPGHPAGNFKPTPLIGHKRKSEWEHKARDLFTVRPGTYTTEWQCDTAVRKRRPLYKTADGYLLSTSTIPSDGNAQNLERFPKNYTMGTSILRRGARFVKDKAAQSWLGGWFGAPKAIPKTIPTPTPITFYDYHSTHIVANSCYGYDGDRDMVGM